MARQISTDTNHMALATWHNMTTEYRLPKKKLEGMGGGTTANTKRLETTLLRNILQRLSQSLQTPLMLLQWAAQDVFRIDAGSARFL